MPKTVPRGFNSSSPSLDIVAGKVISPIAWHPGRIELRPVIGALQGLVEKLTPPQGLNSLKHHPQRVCVQLCANESDGVTVSRSPIGKHLLSYRREGQLRRAGGEHAHSCTVAASRPVAAGSVGAPRHLALGPGLGGPT